jgi:transposase
MSLRKKSSSSARRRASRRRTPAASALEPGALTQGPGLTLRSYEVGALPLINQLLERMQLEALFQQCLPPDDPRCELPTAAALLVLVRNVLVSREPIYAVAEWAARFAPDLFDLWPEEVALLQDDRLGRALTCLFAGAGPELILAVVRRVITEFEVSLEELHNDSTTVSFYGAYPEAAEEGRRFGRATHAITWGYSKDHRPDLKQLLYTLTVSHDGGVPVYFTSHSGNVVDDQTHCATWDILCQLVGGTDFLYVADCKLASDENLGYIARRGGRFVTIMPRTHGEDQQFREQLRQSPDAIRWERLYDVTHEDGEVLDRLSVCADEWLSSAGYRLLWYHSSRKVVRDQLSRMRRVERTLAALAELRGRLLGPRTRFREQAKVQQAVDQILEQNEVVSYVHVHIEEQEQATYRQAQPGRPSKRTQYKKETRHQYHLKWELDTAALAAAEREDGVFPLLTNDRQLSVEEVLRAYKRQPLIEKRFSQFKTDFAVAPVYLKDIGRIQGLLAVYFFVLLVQTLLERELRRAMAKEGLESLPMYPEGRACTRPTTYRLLEIFEPVQRHVLTRPDDEEIQVMVTELTPLQRQIITLLGLSPRDYGL